MWSRIVAASLEMDGDRFRGVSVSSTARTLVRHLVIESARVGVESLDARWRLREVGTRCSMQCCSSGKGSTELLKLKGTAVWLETMLVVW